MSGFDLTSLLPIYLDEVDEQIAALNDTLLRLERDPADAAALRDAFRLVHTIKGSSTMMGFDQVKELTHHLENYFDQLRSGARGLDRTFLDLCFACLDALRDYHRDLRTHGQSAVDLSGFANRVLAFLSQSTVLANESSPPSPPRAEEPELAEPPREEAPAVETPAIPTTAAAPVGITSQGAVCLTLLFEPNLPWPDMKAKLVLNRLAAKARILRTEPPVERLEEVEKLPQLKVWLLSDCDLGELHALADVDGVTEIQVESLPPTLPYSSQALSQAPAAPAQQTAPETPAKQASPAPEASPEEPVAISEAASVPAVAQAAPRKAKVAETVRVEVDRLDHLMNLAGELVINKSRFFEITRGFEELFRTSNANALAADTLDRLEGMSRALETRDDRRSLDDNSRLRWASQLRRLCENFRTIQEELDVIKKGRERLGFMADAIHHLSRVSDGIQRGVLETRMVPVGPLFDRFQRVIRDLRHASSKEINLRTEGEKTELDKRVIDELGDPLIHLVRNAVDHGVEPPEARIAAGKPRAGMVSLAASHRGNSVVITVTDDGRGIDAERVRRKAVARGLIDEAGSQRLTERQIISYIWHPGLSTAETVTDISGRGVGMDIVKSRIEAINGTVDVRSEPGQGTAFIIRLPLTLAIMSVLLTRIGEEAYAIPLDHLNEIVEVGPDQIYSVHGQRSIEIRGRVISLVSLSDVFRLSGPRLAPVDAGAKRTVVMISNGEATLGLIVDELLGMQEAVLKSLEKNFRPIIGLTGASILGDGRVCLILDVDALISMVALDVVHSSET
jgi:two-component system chemotaxis sensor kinase CheA